MTQSDIKTPGLPEINRSSSYPKSDLILLYFMHGLVFPGATVDATHYKNS